MRIAEVIVDITNSQVDKIFDYEIDEMGKVGMRVFVPFGNRIIQGFVINIKDNTTVEKTKLKKVISFVEDYVVIKEELIKLMHFMVKKYHLRYADCLRLFIPSEMRSDTVKPLFVSYVKINEKIDFDDYKKNIRANAKNQIALCNFLEQNKSYLKSKLIEQFSRQTVKKLVDDNVLIESKETIYRQPDFNKIQKNSVVHTPLQNRAINTILSSNDTFLLFGVTGSGKTEVYMSVIEDVIKHGKNQEYS